jgi:DNA polymerase III delta prime subunit
MILQNKLWTEKYRPTKITDYVFVDSNQQTLVESWITEGIIPHLLFSGEPGTGKTTLAKILINELDIDELDVLEINASRENSVDNVRTKIHNFVETMPFGKYKIVLLDEADYLTRDAQASLRNDMETYASTVRFILTCNYEHRVIPALRESRCVKMHISKPDHTEFMARAATVLMAENVQFTIETLEHYVGITYPDLRKCLNQLQANSTSGELLLKSSEDDQHSDLINVVQLFKQDKVIEGRKELLQYLSFNPSRIEAIYKWMYDNLELWGTTQSEKDTAIIIIRNGLANLSLVGIPEINLAATLIELTSRGN